jgi:biotin carboxylase
VNSKPKLLIAGGGYADVPLIKSAQRLGYHVITTGNRPEDLGHGFSDESHLADFSSCDEMLALAKRLDIDAICPCCNDFSAISSAYVAEQLDLKGHDSFDTTKLLHHKDTYRDFAIANDIPTPQARGYSDSESAIRGLKDFHFPIMIKPIDLSGGKGIAKVDNAEQANEAILQAFSISKSKRVVVEEFVEGTNHGFSSLIKDGKVAFHFTDNEHYYLNKYMVSAASTPTLVPDTAISTLVEYSEKIVSLLKLSDGIFHVQFILSGNEPIIIEICRRPPGDLYVNLVTLATGVDYPSLIVEFATGVSPSVPAKESMGFITRHCIMSDRNGVVDDISFSESLDSKIIDRMEWWKQGDIVEDYLTKKFGIIFVRFDSMNDMQEFTKNAHSIISVKIVDD